MKKEILLSEKKEPFLEHVSFFLEEFEPYFLDYFLSSCLNYGSTLSTEEMRWAGLSIYENLFKCDASVEGLREDLLVKMHHDGIMIGFLVNKSMFYLVENYLEFVKNRGVVSQIEHLISCLSRFINLIENEVCAHPSVAFRPLDVHLRETFVSPNSIIEILQKIQDEKGSVQFSNLYQGVPVSCAAKITSVEGETVTFQTERLQEIAMKLDGKAFIIKNDYFSKHIKADILYSNFINNTVTLHNFMYLLNMPALQRKSIRVHPDIVAKVYLNQSDSLETSGRLYDLSLHGLGVLSSENNGVHVGAKVGVSFDLSTAKEESLETISIEAEVVNIFENRDSFRYCMQIFPDKEMKKKILSYITKREKEIIQNLEDELKEYII